MGLKKIQRVNWLKLLLLDQEKILFIEKNQMNLLKLADPSLVTFYHAGDVSILTALKG